MADYTELSGKKHQGSDRDEKYDDNGKLKGRFCPRCGPGCLLAHHKDRVTCGKCGYSEKQMKKEVSKPEPKPKVKAEPKIEEEPKE